MKVTILTAWFRTVAYLRSATNIRTIWHVIQAFFRGVGQSIAATARFVNADSKAELKVTNPTRHDQETKFRRWLVMGALVVLIVFHLWFIRRFGLVGLFFLLGAHWGLFTTIGRTDALVVKVQTRKLAGEMLLRKIVDDLTLTAAQRKQEFSSSIVQPPARLSSNKGYDAVLRVHEQGKPHLVIGNASAVAHKLQRPAKTVFTYAVTADASCVRLLVLDVDPWSLPPTVNPLVAHPRRVNLWKETASMGTRPDFTDVRERLVEEGDGGGRLGGSAPRMGKSVWISNLLVPLMLDPTTHLHVIDGSALDFQAVRSLPGCTYVGDVDITDVELLARAQSELTSLKKEVSRRKSILFKHGVSKLSEAIADQYAMGTHWFICDELAVITEDLVSKHAKAVSDFISDLQWIVRMGPKYGVFCVLATQRPSDKSVPTGLKGMIRNRLALYISDQPGSLAILGKAGPAFRADHLDPDQKGVAISAVYGQFRLHLVETWDLASVAQVAAGIRVQYQSGEPVEDTQMEHPEPVKTLLTVMAKVGTPQVETLRLIEELQDLGFNEVTEKKLAASLKPWGIEPHRFYTPDGRLRGYSRADLERVPKTVRVVSQPVPGTDQDTTDSTRQDSRSVPAHVAQEDGS
jgi:hypothetical protein